MNNREKFTLDEYIADNNPEVLATYGKIEIYSINKKNFDAIIGIVVKMHDLIKGKDLEGTDVSSLQKEFIKKVFPILTNMDKQSVTEAKLKKVIANPSREIEETMVFLFKYLTDFVEDFNKFNEKISDIPKKDYDLLSQTKERKELVSIFEKNGLDKDEFMEYFANKYLR